MIAVFDLLKYTFFMMCFFITIFIISDIIYKIYCTGMVIICLCILIGCLLENNKYYKHTFVFIH